jgi:SAM-dependent methyltransferase
VNSEDFRPPGSSPARASAAETRATETSAINHGAAEPPARRRTEAETSALAAMFAHPGVAEAYQHRPAYPAEVFGVLAGLITSSPRRVLDLGAGEGALARPLAALTGQVDAVDAVDISAAMIETGRRRPGGDGPNLRWITGAVETVPLTGPYALATAGASLHWMDWPQTMGRLASLLDGDAVLAIVGHEYRHPPWEEAAIEVIRRHSRSPSFNPVSVPEELAAAGLLEIRGKAVVGPVPAHPTTASYVEQFHSTSSLAREWMTTAESAEFDAAITAIVEPYANNGVLTVDVVAELIWGKPCAAHS